MLFYNKKQVYKEKYFLKQYNDNYFRVIYCKAVREKGFEECSESVHMKYDKDEVERISLSRTKRNIREICLCNDFEFFCTFTINSKSADRFSLEECQNVLKKHLKAYKRKNKHFKYIFITEKHKNGAFHFHGLIGGIKLGFTEKDDLYINENGYISSKHWDKLGFNSFSKINDYNKTCNYITKYITKDACRNEHNQIYICSRGLKKADSYEIPPIELKWQFENDFIKCIDSYNLSKKDMQKLLTIK